MPLLGDSDLITLFHASIEKQEGTYVVEIPASEIDLGALSPDTVYQIGVLTSATMTNEAALPSENPEQKIPVEEGDRLTVEIEDVGEKGDGVARVDPGYVIFVPETEPGEEVEIEIGNVTSTFAFGEPI